MNKYLKSSLYLLVAILVGVTVTYAAPGSKLTPPSSVSNTMYSLTDIFNLSTGTTIDEGTGTIETTPTLAETGKTLTEVYTALSDEIAKLTPEVLLSGNTILGVEGTATAGTNYGIPKTGQTGCWNASGTSIPCALTGQDGDTLKGVDFSYTDNSNGTITDNTTGLIWQKQDDGVVKNWTNALAYCNSNTAGLPGTGWRLPNIKELQSIVDFSRVSPSINITSFPSTQSAFYWSSTSYQVPGNGYIAWVVSFYSGYMNNNSKTIEYYVRCVR